MTNATQTRATTEDEAANIIGSLEAGDRIEMDGDVFKVLDAWMGGHSGDTPKAKVSCLTRHGSGNREIMPGRFRNNCVAEHGRGMSCHWASVEVVARDLEAHQPDDFEGGEQSTELGASVEDLVEAI